METPNFLIDLFVLALFGIGVYAFLIAPRQREFRQRQKFVSALEVGAEIVTYGGLIGTVTAFDHSTGIVTVKVAEGVELRLIAAAISAPFDREEYAKSAQKALGRDK